MKQFVFPSFIVLFSGILLAIITPDLSTASADSEASYWIRGTVIDHRTGEYLPGVKVFCESTATETYTDFNGMFRLSGNNTEVVSLRFDYISYQSARIENIKASEEFLQVLLEQ